EQRHVYQQALCLLDWGLAVRETDPLRGENLLIAARPWLTRLGAKNDLERLPASLHEPAISERSPRALPASESDSHPHPIVQTERLGSLVEASRRLSATLDVDVLLEGIVDSAARVLGAERGFLYLLDEANGDLRRRASFGARPDEAPVSASVLDGVLKNRKGLVLADAQADPRLRVAESVGSSGVR